MTYTPNPGTGQNPFPGGFSSSQSASGQTGTGTAFGTGFVPQGTSQNPNPYTAGYGAPQQAQTGYSQAYGTGYAPQQGQTGYSQAYGTGYAPQQGQTGYEQAYSTGYMPQGQIPEGINPQASVPPSAPPHHKKKGLVPILILCAILVLTGVFLYVRYAPKSMPFATVRAGNLQSSLTGEALIIRDETVYDADGITSVDYNVTEGLFVSRGSIICQVYSSGYSTREMNALQEFRDQIRDYQINLLNSETTYDARMDLLESDVLTRALEVRQTIAGRRGSLLNLEKDLTNAIDKRQKHIGQKYQGDQRLKRLLDDERAQLQRIDSWTTTYEAAREGIVSFYTDGYEQGLTTSNYATFTPQEVRRMTEGKKPDGSSISKSKTAIFRIVSDSSWNVLMLMDDLSNNFAEGDHYTLQLEKFDNTRYDATVTNSVRLGNELLVRLSISGNVRPVINMRVCTAQLQEMVHSMIVPKKAIYHQDGSDGVVIQDGGAGTFIPVKIHLEKGDEYYVTPFQDGALAEGMTVYVFN